GSVKPDLVAASGMVGLLPPSSTLAKALSDEGSLDPALEPSWPAGEPTTKARARIGTSMTSAALVAGALASLSAQGLRDVLKQRGALTAAALPIDGTAVWRQGAGDLRFAPDVAFATARTLITNHGSFPSEPESGAWTSSIMASGPVRSATTSLPSFVGVGPKGDEFRASTTGQPPVAATLSDSGVTLSLPAGSDAWEGGLYCGYTNVTIPTTGSDVSPQAKLRGVPDAIEQVPTCLVKGTRLRAFNFYIHDIPAEDLTFGLLPALPEEASLLEHHLMILPLDPMHTKLFFKVSGPDGYSDFNNIPPGYYTLRQWSDYGTPIAETNHPGDAPALSDVGENPGYQSYDALVLSATSWNEQDLKDRFGPDNVTPDKPTGGYFVKIGQKTIRVVIEYTKKMPGPSVSSRYIDLLEESDLDFSVAHMSDLANNAVVRNSAISDKLNAWLFTRSGNGIGAFMNPAAPEAGKAIGIGRYPFSLTTPNYKGHVSLNFRYEVTEAMILAIVQMGDETSVAAVTPVGTFRSPNVGLATPVGSGGVAVSGQATGVAHFDFNMKPHGADHGLLTFVFLPSRTVQGIAVPLAKATMTDVSFELNTWTNTLWPATLTQHGQGHSFSISSNFSDRQMKDGCRNVDIGDGTKQLCEDWQVMVHSPGDDAATVDVVDRSGSLVPSLRDEGGRFFDPERGTADFSQALVVGPGKVGSAAVSFDLPQAFKTNGRFWEQLSLPGDFLRKHPSLITFQIMDNLIGRQSNLLPHSFGPVRVQPYFAFRSDALTLDP
ncbi:MAG: hypothetical protein ABR507_02485, partial [Actinomycetota bacterium]